MRMTLTEGFSRKLTGYSNADIEAVILMAHDDAAREEKETSRPIASCAPLKTIFRAATLIKGESRKAKAKGES